jgi:hypothetical protein
MLDITESAVEQRARRAARRIRLLARKSRWRRGTIDNRGGFTLIDPYRNSIVTGQRFDLTAEEVIALCLEKRLAHKTYLP